MGDQLTGFTEINYAQRVAYDTWLEMDTLSSSAESQHDEEAATHYRELRDAVTRLSPLLSSTYFDPKDRLVNVPQYEADTYLVTVAALSERLLGRLRGVANLGHKIRLLRSAFDVVGGGALYVWLVADHRPDQDPLAVCRCRVVSWLW